MKGDLKEKVLFTTLIILMLGAIATFCYAADSNGNNNTVNNIANINVVNNNAVVNNTVNNNITNNIVQEGDNAIRINRKVEFTGKVYRYYTGNKLFFLSAVKKEYPEAEPGCGIINIILSDKKYGIHIMGEGWIAESQIISDSITKYIQLTFENGENNEIISKLKINGEYLKVDSDNKAIITFEDGELKALEDGKTNVAITTKEGEEINVVAIVNDGEITLNVPEKSLSSEMNIDTTTVEKVKINADTKTTVCIEDGSIEIKNEANETIDVNDKNIAEMTTNIDTEVNTDGENVNVDVNGGQKLTLLGRIALALKEALITRLNKEGIADPTIDLNGNVLNEEVNVEDVVIPIFTTLKTILTKIISL